MSTFPETMKTEDIILCLGHHMGMRKPTGPGQAVMSCDELTREKFRNLKSDDLTKIRPDIAAIHASFWDYKETWQANVGAGPRTRIPDEYRTVMLLRFDRNVLGIKKRIKLSAAEAWAWQQCESDPFLVGLYWWSEENWVKDSNV